MTPFKKKYKIKSIYYINMRCEDVFNDEDCFAQYYPSIDYRRKRTELNPYVYRDDPRNQLGLDDFGGMEERYFNKGIEGGAKDFIQKPVDTLVDMTTQEIVTPINNILSNPFISSGVPQVDSLIQDKLKIDAEKIYSLKLTTITLLSPKYLFKTPQI